MLEIAPTQDVVKVIPYVSGCGFDLRKTDHGLLLRTPTGRFYIITPSEEITIKTAIQKNIPDFIEPMLPREAKIFHG